MKVLVLLQLLRSRSVWLGALCIFLMIPLGLSAAVMPIAIPLASDELRESYKDVGEGMPVTVDWQAVLAVDAVRLRQDFSAVDLHQIIETAGKFVKCINPKTTHPIDFTAKHLGEFLDFSFSLVHAAHAWWDVATIHGGVSIELRTADGVPVSGGYLAPGSYVFYIEAVSVPALALIDLHLESEEVVCEGRTLETVFNKLSFTAEERELALALLNSFHGSGPVYFEPNPASPYAWPVYGTITSFYGFREDPVEGGWHLHTGVDIAAAEDTPVVAATAGKVVFAGVDGKYGNVVRLDHGGYMTVYAHLKAILVVEGEEVSKSVAVGTVGSSGKSTGPHLHFEWRDGGKTVDPLLYYR